MPRYSQTEIDEARAKLLTYAPHADRSRPGELHSAVRAAIAALAKATP